MVIVEQEKDVRIYPFEKERGENETLDKFEGRLHAAAYIRVITWGYREILGHISCHFHTPPSLMSYEEFCQYSGELNSAFEQAILLAARSISAGERLNWKIPTLPKIY